MSRKRSSPLTIRDSGLSTGQVAGSFLKRGLDVDIVEPDPAILQVAMDHFNLVLTPGSTANVLGGADFVLSIGEMYQNGTYEGHLWRHAVIDLTGPSGQLEETLATKHFCKGIKELMTDDGVLALVSGKLWISYLMAGLIPADHVVSPGQHDITGGRFDSHKRVR